MQAKGINKSMQHHKKAAERLKKAHDEVRFPLSLLNPTLFPQHLRTLIQMHKHSYPIHQGFALCF